MSQEATILVVEDNPDDVLLIGLALKKLNIANPLRIVSSGEDAVRYFSGAAPYHDRAKFPLPQLTFLDLKMPGVDGFEFLGWLRAQPELRHLPVIVLTSSPYSPDVTRAYQLGANSFVVKPTDGSDYTAALKQVTDFWLKACQLPDGQVSEPEAEEPTPEVRSDIRAARDV